MAARLRIQWNGKKLKDKARRAQVAGVNQTMSEAVIYAKGHHTWRNRTGTLEGSIRIANFATPNRRGVRGVWGSADVRYARRMELGFEGSDRLGRHISQKARPFLRPAADAAYPRLAGNIKRAFR